MHELVKITDMTGRYDITARTLRYYEDIGLLASTRSDDYAYRLYDEAAVQRLEQILILRKLNISIKDISGRYDITARTLRYYDVYVKPGINFLCKYFMNGNIKSVVNNDSIITQQ